jgi:hypothetical protein
VTHVLSRDNGPFKKLLDDLAASKRLTLVVGAGAALDAGLPLWPGLVRTFLEEGFKKAIDSGEIVPAPFPDGSTETYSSLASQVIETQDILRAATIGRYLHGERREEAIKEALYHQARVRPRPGRIIKAIGALAHSLGPRLRIITTNFDDLIEYELDEATDVRYRIYTNSETEQLELVGERGSPEDEAVDIFHLHGYAPFQGEPKGTLILDDEDFSLSPVRPPGEVLPALLDDDATLFIGLSMTDPNLVAACYQAQRQRGRSPIPWHGLFVGKSMSTPDNLAWYLSRSIQGMGINPLDLASYGQVSQVIYEVVRRLADGEDYWADQGRSRYGHRFSTWSSRLDGRYGHVQHGDRYDAVHQEIHQDLCRLLREIQEDDLPALSPEEHLAVHLWVRRPGAILGTLELWGSSAHVHRQGWSLAAQNLSIEGNTGLPVVDSVYQASIQVRNKATGPQSRWQSVVAVPIELTETDYENCVVGVISISSTVEMSSSVLRERRDAALERILRFGMEMLTP